MYATNALQDLFNFLAETIINFVSKEAALGFEASNQQREIGFTFSFPVNQTKVNRGEIIGWTKGFSITDAVCSRNSAPIFDSCHCSNLIWWTIITTPCFRYGLCMNDLRLLFWCLIPSKYAYWEWQRQVGKDVVEQLQNALAELASERTKVICLVQSTHLANHFVVVMFEVKLRDIHCFGGY